MINYGWNCINLRPRTKVQKACKFGVPIEVSEGAKLH
jgi:hypothetical protein